MKTILALLVIVGAAVMFCAFSNASPAARGQAHQIHTTNHQIISRPAGPDDLAVFGRPTVSASFIDQVLCRYHSPACGQGQALYDLGRQYNIDPVFPLAFFLKESSFGTAGVARQSLSLGNLRCVPSADCVNDYAYFASWSDGFKAWYELISGSLYAGSGLTTVNAILPRYAPTGDNNDPSGYAATVKAAVRLWRTGQVALP